MAAAADRPERLNRTLLALFGLGLLAAGTFGLLFGLGQLRTTAPRLDPNTPLIRPGTQAMPWIPYATIAASVVIGVLCLRWLLAQARRHPATPAWQLQQGNPARGATALGATTAADAVAADIETYAGVRKVTVTITGTREQPSLHLEVTTEASTSITALRDRIAQHALPRLRHALELDALPAAELLLRIDAARSTATRTRYGYTVGNENP